MTPATPRSCRSKPLGNSKLCREMHPMARRLSPVGVRPALPHAFHHPFGRLGRSRSRPGRDRGEYRRERRTRPLVGRPARRRGQGIRGTCPVRPPEQRPAAPGDAHDDQPRPGRPEEGRRDLRPADRPRHRGFDRPAGPGVPPALPHRRRTRPERRDPSAPRRRGDGDPGPEVRTPRRHPAQGLGRGSRARGRRRSHPRRHVGRNPALPHRRAAGRAALTPAGGDGRPGRSAGLRGGERPAGGSAGGGGSRGRRA